VEGDRIQSLNAHVRATARIALDFLLPPTCVSCERLLDDGERGLVCGRCWVRLAPLPSPQCPRCGHPWLRSSCSWCELLPPYVGAARSVCWTHKGTGSAIVHALKYGGWHAVARDMAERLARLSWPSEMREDHRVLLPVPLSPSRARERGFNQSERLAHFLAARWQVPVWLDVLERARSTETQTRLTQEERLANVSGAFRVRDATRLRDAHVILVDDVVTTAATLNACAAALSTGGARTLSYVTFGRAPAASDRR
jgi:ComF family protein